MRMRRLAGLLCLLIVGGASLAQAAGEPVNPHASAEARAQLAYLDSISGKGTITGQHNYPNDGSRWTDRAYDLTAKYPGLFGEDFGFSAGDDKDSVLSRPAMTEEVKRQWKNGAVIALTWHAVRPTDDEPVTFRDSVQGHLTDYEWQQLLTPGSPLNNRWCEQVDVIAGYLRQLRDAHVPVLFRPYHEMNGSWFWWGGRPGQDGSAALYRLIFDRFVNVHHLDNLIWVWNVNAPGGAAGPVADYFPGLKYADLVTMDIYGEFKQEFYDSMLALAAGKPIALAEVGGLPAPEALAKQPRWKYFMVWSGLLETSTLERVNAIFRAPAMLNRDDARLAGPMESIRKATADRVGNASDADPVTPNATGEAKALLARLAAASGNAILSGQEVDAASPVTAAQETPAGKPQAAIFAAELVAGQAGASLKEKILRAHAEHSVVRLAWHPARPTDNASASAHGQLTEFEWNELLTPGSSLNKRWCEQADEAAAMLKELEKAGVAVMWSPYPGSNGKDFWWAGRKGIRGSAALYRLLFERLVRHHGLRNLLWVWEADPPAFGPGATGMLSDYFPGLLYADALELRIRQLNTRFPSDRFLALTAVGKPIGVDLTGDVPEAESLTAHSAHSLWSWFVLGAAADSPARAEALKRLFADEHIVSRR